MSEGYCPFISNLNVSCTFSKRLLTQEEAEKANTVCLHDWRRCADYQNAARSGAQRSLTIEIQTAEQTEAA